MPFPIEQPTIKKIGDFVYLSINKIIKNSVGPFKVFIDSKLDPDGSLTIGEVLIEGSSKEEILISTYLCHPSMANDNLVVLS